VTGIAVNSARLPQVTRSCTKKATCPTTPHQGSRSYHRYYIPRSLIIPHTGAVSIAASKFADTIYAIDIRDEAIDEAERNFAAAGIADRVTLIHGEAAEAIRYLPRLDCAFVGGTKNVESVLQELCTRVEGRVVANAARIETAARIIGCMKSLGIFEEVVHVQVSKG
jgi:cobalt-precorrin-6B (C15)-methyltransferase